MADLKNTHLRMLSEKLEKHIEAVRRFGNVFNPQQLNWKQDEKSWSIAQCLDHIIISDQQYFNGIKKAIELTTTGQLIEKKPYRPSLFGRWFAHMMKPRSFFKFKTFPIFQPSARTEGKKILEDFIRHEQELLILIKKCDGWDVNPVKLRSPVNSFFKFSLGESFAILVNHQERHLEQARRVAENAGFPKGTS